MGHYYLDSSALVKRYVAEAGTNWIQNLCAPGADHTLYTIRISGAEVVAALFRRVAAEAAKIRDIVAKVQFQIALELGSLSFGRYLLKSLLHIISS